MPELFDIGDVVRALARFRNVAGVLTDPTSVVGRVRKPDGTLGDVTFAKDTPPVTGEYIASIAIDQSGDWWVRATSTGTVASSVESIFTVRERRVG